MHFGVAVFPVKPIQDFANGFRKRYDPHYALIQPHITVREPEEWEDSQVKAAVAHLDSVCSATPSFPVRFNRVSTFYPVNNVLYLAMEDPEPFRLLYDRICSGVLEETNRRYHVNPHLTIGQQMNSDELHDVYASLRKQEIDFAMTVDRVHLLYQTENGAWTAYQTFLLQG